MRKDLVEIVCCPVHKTPLALTVKEQDAHGDIVEGSLRCSTCRFDYPIEEGIPNLLPPEYHVEGVKERASRPTPAKAAAKPAKAAKAASAKPAAKARK
ncbi:MAG: uncharacterized protein QOJ26_880 [Thermoplasmata archaeon]|nr:uncharacterized protein [Thermoplasmata archaeon]